MTQHESGGLTSQHDIEIFRAWARAFPGYTWSRADVDRVEGLTLTDMSYGMTTRLHFPHTICGFDGEGPRATVTILVEAGFGESKDLSDTVYAQSKASFTK